ncbi:hypothetical protein LSH36_91g00008 [Paralvinella palmiformis]|uniref:Fucosyltransferase n=1 Tax=Paralvinella palmiformis TaxID=53620 RepID=A0AAD9K127_9ANNE|nr:hypothetical protein LSH36_91g00008 [Paralvinella palmiformis]
MSRVAVRILWFAVFLLGSTLVLWGLLQDQVPQTYDTPAGGPQLVGTSRGHFPYVGTTSTPYFRPVPGGSSPKLRPPKSSRIWPTLHEREDRILTQLNLIPTNPKHKDQTEQKLILLYNGLPDGTLHGSARFRADGCPVDNCFVSNDRDVMDKADAVVFEGGMFDNVHQPRPPGQIWILFLLESPENVADFTSHRDVYNWTATYRLDSTINTPYERFIPYANASDVQLPPPRRNYAKGKTKKVAWFVSNCYSVNKRGAYATELAKYIAVDVYGACGNMTCLRDDRKRCYQMLTDTYKFYLAFENSNCRDYITEKFYWNALYNDIVPVVMGAHPDDYAAVAPPGSYIHVDDFESPRHLAEYLHKLDNNDTLYNEYFRWKGSGEFINTKYWCRLCSLVHEAASDRAPLAMWYGNMGRWWNGPGICVHPRTNDRWATWRNQTSFGDVFAAPNTLNVLHRVIH